MVMLYEYIFVYIVLPVLDCVTKKIIIKIDFFV
jgi:hypothetical protein